MINVTMVSVVMLNVVVPFQNIGFECILKFQKRLHVDVLDFQI